MPGLAPGFASIASVYFERGASTLAWSALAPHAFAWPHLAAPARARIRTARSARASWSIRRLGGIRVALMQFSLLPSVLVVAMLGMDKLEWDGAFVTHRSDQLPRERRQAVEEMAALREQLAHIGRVGTLGEMAAGEAV